jgi:hypothetical protein
MQLVVRVGFAVHNFLPYLCAFETNQDANLFAVRVGFEPTVAKYDYKGFQDLRLKPLGHLTRSSHNSTLHIIF